MSASKNNNNNNNNDNNDDIAPETPVFTSMLIRSAAPAIPGPRSLNHIAKQQHHQFEVSVPKSRVVESSKATASWEPHSIPQLPEYYPLERSHVSMKNVSCNEVCSRIAECLRTESVSATFTENKAVAETQCHTQFFVQLFESNAELIVEVQRRTGCSYKFRQCSRAILRAAKGESIAATTMSERRSLPRSLPPMPASQEDDSLEIAFGLLSQDRLDAQMLGMQSLLSLSASSAVFPSIEQVNIIVNHSMDRQSELRRDALTVLANCLTKGTIEAPENEILLQILIADLTDQDLHAAYQAARCLTAICQTTASLKALVLKLGSTSAAQMALQEGQSKHALLEQETRLLQKELES